MNSSASPNSKSTGHLIEGAWDGRSVVADGDIRVGGGGDEIRDPPAEAETDDPGATVPHLSDTAQVVERGRRVGGRLRHVELLHGAVRTRQRVLGAFVDHRLTVDP